MASDRLAFADLTAPLTPEEFLSKFWTREAVLLRAAGRTFAPYFGWDALNGVLNIRDLDASAVKVVRDDKPVPPAEYTTSLGGHTIVNARAVVALFDEGASFGVSGADKYWPPLRAVVNGMYDALLESPHTNVYCSPPNIQGFHCHFDLHEVCVLQVEGSKHWRVFTPTRTFPTTSWNMEEAKAVLDTAPYLDVVLRAGDVLYVPRGHWHYAIAEDDMSLHVTLGISCRKGLDFCRWLADELEHEAIWRENAPLLGGAIAGGTFQSPADLASWGERLRRSLIAKASEPDVFERYSRHVADASETRSTIAWPFQSATMPAAVDGLVFARPTGRRHVITEADDVVTVTSAGSELQLERVYRPVLATIFEADTFSARDVLAAHPSVSPEDLADLLRELMRLGLLSASQE